MRLPALSASDLDELQPYGFAERTPLFYYVLKEAELMESGLHPGHVGGRIVAEVILGLLQLDRHLVSVGPPELPAHTSVALRPSEFRMVDLLSFASMDPHSRGQ
jgi:hypothetical protein